MLEFKNLQIESAEKTLVKEVSFTVPSGKIVSLVGESGSGKSLTCLSVLGLLPAGLRVSGSIHFTDAGGTGKALLNAGPELRSELALKTIAYVFQEPLSALNPVQKCGRQLAENLILCGYKGKQNIRQKCEELLSMVELNAFDRVLNAFPHQLSGGQRQRVMIAMAMAGNPELIIADEPTTALDVLLQDEILGLLRKLCLEKGKSILLVSHDLDAVRRYSDHIVVMYRGEIVEQGSAKQIIDHAAHPYTRALLACKPRPANKGRFLPALKDGVLDSHAAVYREPEIDSEPVLQVLHAGKDFTGESGVHTALKDISFSIRRGSACGLIGESGSGKSTLSRILVRLESPSRGELIYDFKNGKPLSSNVQMVFQDPFAALNPAINIRDMLTEVLERHRPELNRSEIQAELLGLLHKVGLDTSRLDKFPNSFSGGQRQRLCIARALAARPALLICDEATSALDLSIQAQILNLLKSLQISEQLTVLMITHSMAVASWFCDELIVLKNGEIVEAGPASKLMESPVHAYTRAMLEHI